MPGGDLLFRCLSSSIIGAVGFHGRVRDGIGWFTDAMATRQWSRRIAHAAGVLLRAAGAWVGFKIDACIGWTIIHGHVGRRAYAQGCW
jgi:hypothetical protein